MITYFSGTEGYAEDAEILFERYRSMRFEDAHQSILHLFPIMPARILDIGSGSGWDAVAFYKKGHTVMAVEPTDALRERAKAQNPDLAIEWIKDGLPELAVISKMNELFDVILLSAVWMHLDVGQRRHALPVIVNLLSKGGRLFMSLRHGPVPDGRRMFDVSAEETEKLARAEGLDTLLKLEKQVGILNNPGVTWSRLAFCRPE